MRNVLYWSVKTDRLISLVKLVEGELQFLWILPPIHSDQTTFPWIELLGPHLEAAEFEKKSLAETFKRFAKEQNVKVSKILMPLRLLLTGSVNGPGVTDIMTILGKESTLKRIRRQIQPNLANARRN